MTVDEMIKQLQFHATYFDSIYAQRAAEEMRSMVQVIRLADQMRDILRLLPANIYDDATLRQAKKIREAWDALVGEGKG